ncbi:hypothetical protein PILCRDRAFT_3770 [Piloderma croceum F 1598]|uniref:Uncharacterized protein n=1 Tax=Piloderma croceum (strain F 1598) TaxID=765440 RepID=A0A0C3G9F9_PILCF|nr:hypothetical protein PILCRDRAFT_3770 [Piloderma croceum F 1598]
MYFRTWFSTQQPPITSVLSNTPLPWPTYQLHTIWRTTITCSVVWGNDLVVRLLIEQGMDDNTSRYVRRPPIVGSAPIHFAAAKGHINVAIPMYVVCRLER